MFTEFFEKTKAKPLTQGTNEEIYASLIDFTEKCADERGENVGKKKLYYISAEFLTGKLLGANLINLGIYDDVAGELSAAGKSMDDVERIEPEPALGNGGLGRLAACFMDSAATLGIPASGVGLCYHCGLFRQKFVNNKQTEAADCWIGDRSWLNPTDVSYTVDFKDFSVKSKLYTITVTGFGGKSNKLCLFDNADTDESVIKGGIDFDKNDIRKNLTLFLYPDDSDTAGKKLRIYQQYFMVSNAAHLIINEAIERGSNLRDLADYAVIQINDTHPTMIIPELIRLLEERGIAFDEAVDVAKNVCAYTNHTILAEALEKWPVEYLEDTVPKIMDIIRRLNEKTSGNTSVIIDGKVHMAHLAIHFSFSVNGVAELHTEILKNEELKSFYTLFPEKFNNKTNGITFRRWLIQANPLLTDLIRNLTGDGFLSDSDRLAELKMYADDNDVLSALTHVKAKNKLRLKEFLAEKEGVKLNDGSIFNIQAKRLHEYKRQQLNALYIISKYMEIKSGILPKRPIAFIFGAKAAPAYTLAKDIIHLILCISKIINDDASVAKYIQVVMTENYNVTLAQKLIPACDISQQISLASKEASGTGNMKFMLNGAVTLGTADGANAEIADLVGKENIYIFGKSADEVIGLYKSGRYNPRLIYNSNKKIKQSVDFITSAVMLKTGDSECLRRLQSELLNKDWFMTLLDFEDYIRTMDNALNDYENRILWAKKSLVNISEARFFSSDRTVTEYNRDIWKI